MKTNGGRGFATKPILLLAVVLFLQVSFLFADEISKPRLVRAGGNHIPDSSVTGQKAVSLKNSKALTAGNSVAAKSAAVGVSASESLADKTVIRFQSTAYTYPKNAKKESGVSRYEKEELVLYALALRKYARQFGYDTSYAFLANMGMGSAQKRFFVINLKTLEIESSGLVSHGFGNSASFYDRAYSNKPGSKCTSLGKYCIAGKYNGTYGYSFKLKGLDSTNSNALKRKIVLHSMGCIPDKESNAPACVSEGCPAVSQQFFGGLRKLIEQQKRPILLWVYDSNLEKPVVELPQALVEKLKYFERW